MPKNDKNILVLGVGNDILTDDGIGPKLCDFLKEKYRNKPVDFEKLNVGGIEILEFIQGYKTVIFIDAIKSFDGQIGEVNLYTPANFKETLHLSNLHDTNFITALELGKSLDLKIPEKMYIITVEIKEDMVFSEYFTEELAIKYNEIKEKIVSLLNELIPEILHPKNKNEDEYI
ncbi:hydrogenase maturation protease [Prolixibacteraceae bacterium Z1-6]|uniref:Hydrogenase maturation protease n=1 Tax=Draconibacterium aestuarii TaxID=2998507 RepID=A0A9X3FDP5_9BACT|nr:hydrogenase maturation protease [Prolixibacteraceae bacterium Z1-6]